MNLANVRLKYGRPRKDWLTTDIDFIWSHITPPSRVLDYGCGNGSIGYLGTDNERMIQVLGLDEFDPGNTMAKYHSRSEVEGTFDLIVARHVIEHMEWGHDGGELRDFLKWCHQHSRKLITVSPNPNRYYSFKEDPTHKTECNNTFYVALCEDAGWHVTDVLLTDLKLGSKVFFLPRLALSLFEGVAPLFSHIVVMEH
jgi:SAM-dependent methyltransferase